MPESDEDTPKGVVDGSAKAADRRAEREPMATESGAGSDTLGDVITSTAGHGDPPAIHQVELDAYAILGTSSMPVSQLLRMGRGAVVELDRNVGDKIELRVNDLLVARGEIVVVEDRIAVEITEIVRKEK